MAKIAESVIVIKASRLLKDSDSATEVLNEETIAALEAVVEELAGEGVLVEIATIEE